MPLIASMLVLNLTRRILKYSDPRLELHAAAPNCIQNTIGLVTENQHETGGVKRPSDCYLRLQAARLSARTFAIVFSEASSLGEPH